MLCGYCKFVISNHQHATTPTVLDALLYAMVGILYTQVNLELPELRSLSTLLVLIVRVEGAEWRVASVIVASSI